MTDINKKIKELDDIILLKEQNKKIEESIKIKENNMMINEIFILSLHFKACVSNQ